MSGIYLLQGDGKLVEMNEQEYDSEELLQKLLAQYPSLLAGSQMNSDKPRRWLLVSREAGVPDEENGSDRWSLDHLFLDQDAVPTLVEVKRSSDTRLRREVVGQMLDYAANAVLYWPVEEIRAKFAARCEDDGKDAAGELDAFLEGELEADQFWMQVKTNLQAGKIRMVFVADEIPSELRRIVEFLNQQMEFAEVLAVEIKQFVGQGLTTLVPRVMGQTAESEKAKSAGGRREFREWNEAAFFEVLQQNVGEKLVAVARELTEWGKVKASGIRFGSGTKVGALMPYLEHNGADGQCFKIRTDGDLQISFHFHRHLPAFDKEEMREKMRLKLNEITGITIGSEEIHAHPKFQLRLLAIDESRRKFLAAFDWFIEQVKAS